MNRSELARKIGMDACIDKIGRDFVEKYKNNATCASGERYGELWCFVGIDMTPDKNTDGILILDSESKFMYSASCFVDMETGSVTFDECILPSNEVIV